MKTTFRETGGAAVLAVLLSAAAQGTAAAQQLDWKRGPGTFEIGEHLAQVELTEEYVFLDRDGTRQLMELMENPLSGAEVATIAHVSDSSHWILIFEYDAIGYVEDEERNSLDANAILASIRKGTERGNKARRRKGWAPLDVVGWHRPPHYDTETHNLTWAIIGLSDGDTTINQIVKLLGRRGVMTATLVSDTDELTDASAHVNRLLTAHSFLPGNRYAEFVRGKDDIAKVGLTALVVGGAGAALVKSGLLVRLWKVLVAGVVAALAGVRRLFRGGAKTSRA